MKTTRIVAALFVVTCLSLASATANPLDLAKMEALMQRSHVGAITPLEASTISRSLTEALASDHRGLESAALRLIITYGEDVHISRAAVIEVVRLYRDNPDPRMRQMAIVALGSAGDAWGIDFLKRSEAFEGDARLRHTLRAVLAEA